MNEERTDGGRFNDERLIFVRSAWLSQREKGKLVAFGKGVKLTSDRDRRPNTAHPFVQIAQRTLYLFFASFALSFPSSLAHENTAKKTESVFSNQGSAQSNEYRVVANKRDRPITDGDRFNGSFQDLG